MKRFKYIVWGISIVVAVFYILPVTLLQVPYFQRKIANIATGYLENKLGTTVKIQRVEFQPFNQLILKEVYLEDQSGDTLFSAKRIAAGFDFIPLFKNKFHFSSAQLYSFEFHLHKEQEDAPLNIQYILDAFQSKEKKETNIDLNIKNLSLGHGTFSYRVKNKAASPGKFNPDDIYISDITAKVKLNDFTNNHIDALIKRSGFTEKSGLRINQLAFDLLINADSSKINRLDLELPRSDIHLTNITADYSNRNPEDNILDKVSFDLRIEPSRFQPKDISPMAPVFAYFKDVLEMEGKASGSFNDLNLTDFKVKDANDVFIGANANVRDLNSSDAANIYVSGNLKNSFVTAGGLQKIADNFSPETVLLPEPVKRLEQVSFNGEASGYLDNITAFINFKTGVGDLRTDVNFGRKGMNFLKGKISTPEINIGQLLNSADFGITGFEITLDALFKDKSDLKGHIDALVHQFDYKSYNYKNISLLGDFTADSFNGLLKADSPDGQLAADGLFLLKRKDSEFNFSAKATNLLLDKLNLTHKYKEPELSFTLNANMKGNAIDNLIGNVSFHNVLFSNDKGGYAVNRISVDILENDNQKQMLLDSDIATGKIEGLYAIRSLPEALKQTVAKYLPHLMPVAEKPVADTGNNFKLDFTINDTKDFSYILDLPVTLYNQSQISGEYDDTKSKFRLNAHFPRLSFGNSVVEEGRLDLNNGNDYIELKLNGISQQKKDNKLIIAANFKALNDSIYSDIQWKDNKELKYKGKLDFISYLALPDGNEPVTAAIRFQPSELVFNDSIWSLSPAKIDYREGRLNISHFIANHNKQAIEIEGNISEDVEDGVSVSLEKVDLDYIFKSLNIKALTFGGIATGFVTAKDIYHTRQLSTYLDVTGFSFNNTVFGDLDLQGRWNSEKQGVEMKGKTFKNDSTYIDVDGIIYPVKEELSILFDAHHTDATFLRKYLDNVVQNLSGELTGNLRLFGDLNNPTVEGDVWVNNGNFGVEFLNTDYTFTDWVKCTADEISIKNVILRDKYGNKALANGYVHHHLFDDFRFSAALSYEDFMIYNATAQSNPSIYGPVFGTGTATLKGTEDLVFIDVSMSNNANTALTLNFMKEPDVVDYNFINFVKKEKDSIPAALPGQSVASIFANQLKWNSGTEIRLNLLLNANNEAKLEMIMDPLTGDKISATGSGIMQIQYGTQTPIRVFGNYRIERGSYNFSLQQAFFRNFDIEEGSTVAFHGDPFVADLNVKAAYRVTANIEDLDPTLAELNLSARNNIPVNCVLLLSGPLEHPLIKFDLELPGSISELERQVKSYIRTDDMMNRQIAYLLVMGRFYTSPEYTRNDARVNNDLSILTSTLSNQISNLLGLLSDNFQVGTKFHQTYEGDATNTEVEVLLSSSLLNNRLIINGNFGYIDNAYTNANSNVPLVGDFDIEYKLTKRGDIRLKGFNHYNYRNYYSQNPEMTQGVGILFRRDFNTLRDFLYRRKEWRLIVPAEEEKPAPTTEEPQEPQN
ncbi:MAG: translocation/assembly module TamB [Candidatus Symbiothrix sp.]|jgi:hypothetical protein|nr:translocation/assembly module TamB [Candidatus Symbiothrix sp.]